MFSVPLIVPDLVLIPLIGAGLIFFLPNQYAVWARRVAISATFLTLVGALLLFTNYNPAASERTARIPSGAAICWDGSCHFFLDFEGPKNAAMIKRPM